MGRFFFCVLTCVGVFFIIFYWQNVTFGSKIISSFFTDKNIFFYMIVITKIKITMKVESIHIDCWLPIKIKILTKKLVWQHVKWYLAKGVLLEANIWRFYLLVLQCRRTEFWTKLYVITMIHQFIHFYYQDCYQRWSQEEVFGINPPPPSFWILKN